MRICKHRFKTNAYCVVELETVAIIQANSEVGSCYVYGMGSDGTAYAVMLNRGEILDLWEASTKRWEEHRSRVRRIS